MSSAVERFHSVTMAAGNDGKFLIFQQGIPAVFEYAITKTH